ncbi:MAG: hypothetical protein Q7S88_03060 [Candidatus Daviesbacteria bacterium]|nr:hypothetical protein [Candidatus Daviesbacteria bacterium]
MSRKIEAIEEMAGVALGNVGESSQPFLKALGSKGLPIPNSKWPYKARVGLTEGTRHFHAVSIVAAKGQNSRKKDDLYHRIATEATLLRTYGNGVYSKRYESGGYLAEVAKNLTLGIGVVRECIQAMRVDLVFGFQDDHQTEDSPFFGEIVEQFLRANTTSPIAPSFRPNLAVRLDMEWDRKSPVTFYQKVFEILGKGSNAIRTWMPYEAEAMQHYYNSRIKTGSLTTPFDLEVRDLKNRRQMIDLGKRLTDKTSIYVLPRIINVHRNALVYGDPLITAPTPGFRKINNGGCL